MKAIRKKNFREAIIELKILDDASLLVVDSKTTVRYLEKSNFSLLNGFKANILHKRYKNSVVAFSSDGAFFASLSADEKETVLYNAVTKKAISKVTRHQGEVSCVGIDPKNRYMFSCGDDGKTFATDMKSGKLAFTLPAHADTINDIEFSKNGQWVAVGSYDKKILIFNIAMMNVKHKIKAHATAVMKLKFLSKHRLFSIDKNNRAVIWDTYTGKVLHRMQGIHDNLTQLTTASDDKFLFIGTALGYVLVYELETYELLDKKYIKLTSSITSMIFDEESQELIIGTQDGDVAVYNIYEGEKELKGLLEKREMGKIQEYVEKNPLLEYTDIYKYVSTLWDKTLEKAKIYLENNDRATAASLFEVFNNIPAKKGIIKKTLAEYDEFEKFSKLIREGKLALAYGVVAQHPIYKDSKTYKNLELKWQKTFAIAQKYALEPKGVEKAREILTPFRGVSHKTALIQEMFAQSKAYDRFKLAVGKKDFKIALDLVKMHPFIKEFPEYAKIMAYADTLFKKSKELIIQGEIDTAQKFLTILSDFGNYKDDIKALMLDIKNKQKFTKAIKSNNLLLAYALLDESDDLLETQEGKELNNEWNYSLAKANNFAAKGNVAGVQENLEKYLKIDSKFMSIASAFAWCYMIQLENAIRAKEKQEVIEEGVRHYVLQFGYTDQIDSFVSIFKRYYKNSRLNLEFDPKGSMSMWNPSMIVNSILE